MQIHVAASSGVEGEQAAGSILEATGAITALASLNGKAHLLAIGITPGADRQQSAAGQIISGTPTQAARWLHRAQVAAIGGTGGQLTEGDLPAIEQRPATINRAIDQDWGAINGETGGTGGTQGGPRQVAIHQLHPIVASRQELVLEIDPIRRRIGHKAVPQGTFLAHFPGAGLYQPEACGPWEPAEAEQLGAGVRDEIPRGGVMGSLPHIPEHRGLGQGTVIDLEAHGVRTGAQGPIAHLDLEARHPTLQGGGELEAPIPAQLHLPPFLTAWNQAIGQPIAFGVLAASQRGHQGLAGAQGEEAIGGGRRIVVTHQGEAQAMGQLVAAASGAGLHHHDPLVHGQPTVVLSPDPDATGGIREHLQLAVTHRQHVVHSDRLIRPQVINQGVIDRKAPVDAAPLGGRPHSGSLEGEGLGQGLAQFRRQQLGLAGGDGFDGQRGADGAKTVGLQDLQLAAAR